ncbi:hypothetical protein [Aeromicrobium sp. UC242_57]
MIGQRASGPHLQCRTIELFGAIGHPRCQQGAVQGDLLGCGV